MTEFQGQWIDHKGKNIRPHVSVVMNFTKPTEEKPALLTLGEVETFLHEFGHSLHGMFANTRFESLSGTNVWWDFVELPSQFMENYAIEKDFLRTFAFHYQTGEPLPDDVKQQLRKEYNRAKKEYDKKLAGKYYTSGKFVKDTAVAAGKRGAQMGLRQALGFVFTEVWFTVKEELQNMPKNHELKDMLEAVGRGIKKGFENAKSKYKEIIAKIEEGFTSGVLASLTTTICNIFFTTAKNLATCIRQIYASIVEAGKVLLFNPDNLMFGDRIKAATIVIATGASVLVGTVVGDAVSKTPIGSMPGVGEIVKTFCSSFVSGMLSCTLLVFLDRSKFMNSLVVALNCIPSEANNYKEIADAMENLAAKFANLDIDKFKKDTEMYHDLGNKIENASNEEDLNELLKSAYRAFNINIPWKGDFDAFMGNKDNHLVFS